MTSAAVRWLIGAAALLGACVAEGSGGPDAGGMPTYEVESVQSSTGMREAFTPSVCEYLPADGACAAACDHEALTEFVPAGTCAVFACTLTDGRTLTVHACAPH